MRCTSTLTKQIAFGCTFERKHTYPNICNPSKKNLCSAVIFSVTNNTMQQHSNWSANLPFWSLGWGELKMWSIHKHSRTVVRSTCCAHIKFIEHSTWKSCWKLSSHALVHYRVCYLVCVNQWSTIKGKITDWMWKHANKSLRNWICVCPTTALFLKNQRIKLKAQNNYILAISSFFECTNITKQKQNDAACQRTSFHKLHHLRSQCAQNEATNLNFGMPSWPCWVWTFPQCQCGVPDWRIATATHYRTTQHQLQHCRWQWCQEWQW